MNPLASTLTFACIWRCAAGIAVAAVPYTASAAGAQAPATPAAPDTFWGKPVDGLQAGIRIAGGSSTVRVGDRLKVELVLRNTTDHATRIGYGNAQNIYGWRLKRQKDGAWELAPRWRYWREEKLEGIVAGAMEIGVAPHGELLIPMKQPEILITGKAEHQAGQKGGRLVLVCGPGDTIRLRALPITAAARGEEWLDRLETGLVTLKVAVPRSSKPGAATQPEQNKPAGVSWGPEQSGLRIGIRYVDGKAPRTTGEQLWMELYVRNDSPTPRTVSYQTGSVYIDPPVEVEAVGARGESRERCEVIGGSGQIVRPFALTLKPGELALIGHPNYLLYPHVQRPARGLSVYPEMNVAAGDFRVRQSFPVELEGRTIRLTSGPLDLRLEPHRTPIAWGPAENGIRVGIGFQNGRGEFHVGDTAALFVYAQNVTGATKRFTRLTNADPPSIECRDRTGARVEVRHARTTLLPTDQTVDMKPGEIVLLSSTTVEIRADFKMPDYPSSALTAEPGRYVFVLPRVTDFSRPDERARPRNPSGELSFTILPK